MAGLCSLCCRAWNEFPALSSSVQATCDQLLLLHSWQSPPSFSEVTFLWLFWATSKPRLSTLEFVLQFWREILFQCYVTNLEWSLGMMLALWAIRISVMATSLTLSSYRPQLAGTPSLYLSSPLYHPIPPPPPDPSSLKSLLLHHGEMYCSQGKVPIPLHGSIFTHCQAPRRLFTVHPEWRRRSDKENSCSTL